MEIISVIAGQLEQSDDKFPFKCAALVSLYNVRMIIEHKENDASKFFKHMWKYITSPNDVLRDEALGLAGQKISVMLSIFYFFFKYIF